MLVTPNSYSVFVATKNIIKSEKQRTHERNLKFLCMCHDIDYSLFIILYHCMCVVHKSDYKC